MAAIHLRPPRRRWRFALLAWLMISAAIGFWSLDDARPLGEPGLTQTAEATPHLISYYPEEFDPDWLYVQWMLAVKCNGCHRAGTDRHDFTSYEALVGDGVHGDFPVIVPGDPESSYLWQQVVWNHTASPDSPHPDVPAMPIDEGEWLTAGQLETIQRWIRNGAFKYRLPPQCDTSPIVETDFPSARECAACHPKQYREWSRSMHAYGQHSPAFEAFTLTMIERTEGTIGTFCTRCHTPIGVSLGETGSTRNVHRSRISMEGVTCVVCHRLQTPYYKASGRLPVDPGQLLDRCIHGPFENPVVFNGSTHPAVGDPYLMSSAFCGSCHDVTSPAGMRLEEAFSEWQNSPAARENISCQLCHMGPVQGVPIARLDRPWGKAADVPGVDPSLLPDRPLSDHTMAGPDYSLLPDTEFPYKLDWMYEVDYTHFDQLTPHQQETLTQLRLINRQELAIADQQRYELLRNAAEISVSHPEVAQPGSPINIHVDVTSLFAGHNLPTGFTAERQVWVEVVLVDPCGDVVFASGDLDSNGDLRDEHSHEVESGHIAYDPFLLNFQSKFVVTVAQGTERSLVIPVNRHLSPLTYVRPAPTPAQSFGRPEGIRVAKSNLPPLQTAGANYPVLLPRESGVYHVGVRLNFRHLPPVLFDHIGIPHLKHLLEVVVIDEYQGTIEVCR